MVDSIRLPVPADSGPGDAHRPKNAQEAASAFEAFFVGNLLKSAREASQGLGEQDQAGSTMMDMAQEYLANEITKGGGIGLVKMIASHFANRQDVAGNQNEQ